MQHTSAPGVTRDEKGRPLADDGWPVSGLATVAEVCAASSISRSQVYAMLQAGKLPSRQFGRSRRIPWSIVREVFLQDGP